MDIHTDQAAESLLSIYFDVAGIRRADQLAGIFEKKLKTFLHIRQYILFRVDSDDSDYTAMIQDWNEANFDLRNALAAANISDPTFSLVAEGALRVFCLPLLIGTEKFGILIIEQEETEKNTEFNNRYAKHVSCQLAIAISNIMISETLRNKADETSKFNIVNHLHEIDSYRIQLEEEKIYLKREIEITQNYSEIVGDSPEMQKIFRLIGQVATSDSTVLILGETGTGKELIARAIHNNSPRKSRMMVKVNCAALPENLIESELFGHEKGSFTSAIERRLGKFELANQGTLFLDEIGDMPFALQVKLLRALQEREIERIGGRGSIKVNVRVIAATSRDLERALAEGRFRADLYYRLNIFPIYAPPLRDRPGDILPLTNFFINRFSKKAGKKMKTISKIALDQLLKYGWPGNIRELEHLIERSVLLSTGEMIRHFDLPLTRPAIGPEPGQQEFSIESLDDNERDHILKALKYCQGKVSGKGGASELLGVPASTLNSKMKKLGIRREHQSGPTGR
jgi:transcriptional regulator with GAF, ATPase, and Fis domain